MPILIGLVLGHVLARVGFFRAAGALIVLAAVGFAAWRLMLANGDPRLATAAGFGVPLLVVVWAAWNPVRSKLQLWLFDGVFLVVRLLMWLSLIYVASYLFEADFHVPTWLRIAWPYAAVAGVAWGIQRIAEFHFLRRHAAMGSRSVWDVE